MPTVYLVKEAIPTALEASELEGRFHAVTAVAASATAAAIDRQRGERLGGLVVVVKERLAAECRLTEVQQEAEAAANAAARLL